MNTTSIIILCLIFIIIILILIISQYQYPINKNEKPMQPMQPIYSDNINPYYLWEPSYWYNPYLWNWGSSGGYKGGYNRWHGGGHRGGHFVGGGGYRGGHFGGGISHGHRGGYH